MLCPTDPQEFPDFPFGESQPFYSLPSDLDDVLVPGLQKHFSDAPGKVILCSPVPHVLYPRSCPGAALNDRHKSFALTWDCVQQLPCQAARGAGKIGEFPLIPGRTSFLAAAEGGLRRRGEGARLGSPAFRLIL